MRKPTVLTLLAVVLVGCNNPIVQGDDPVDSGAFPVGAYDINHIGNGYATFELETNGKVRKFMIAQIHGSSPTISITEIPK